jgi:microcystin-dependent protein
MSKKFLSPIKLAQGTSVPSTGSSGELFYNTTDAKIYTHNGTAWVASGGGVTNSATAPENPANGDAWFNTTEGSLFVYYNDGDSGQWVEATNNINNAEPNQIPAGAMMAWSGSVIPNNWLLCDGSAVSRETYASLFAAIGTTYGSGNGTTTFNLPNLKGKTIVGLDGAQTEFDALGETGGTKTHTLTASEMPSHTHAGTSDSAGSHTHTGTTSTTGAHTHTGTTSTGGAHTHAPDTTLSWLMSNRSGGTNASGGGSAQLSAYSTSTNSAGSHNHTFTSDSSGSHNHTFTTDGDGAHSHTFTSNATGGGTAHNNLQPYIVLNYIIKHSAGETPGDSELATRIGAVETANNLTPLSSNYIINGGMDIWQRGTSFSGNGYTADRWNSGNSPSAVSRSTDVPNGFTYALDITGSNHLINQRIESANATSLYGQSTTVSFYAKSSSGSNTMTVAIGTPSAKDNFATQNIEYTSSAITITSSWARYTTTFSALSSSVTNGAFIYIYRNGSNGTDRTLITGVQLEAGPYATPFRLNAPSLQAELAACQRYYETFAARKLNNEGYAAGTGYGYYMNIGWAVTKRVAPTVTLPATTFKVTSNESSNSFIDGYSYQFASNGAGNFYMLWNAGLTGTADAEL